MWTAGSTSSSTNLAGGPADADVRRAAHLREGLQRGGHQRPRPRGGAQGQDLPLGGAGRQAQRRRSSRPASRCRPGWPRSGASPTSSSSASCSARLGGRIRVLVSGSAPLSERHRRVLRRRRPADLRGVRPDRDLAPATSSTAPGRLRIGTVGQPLGDLECKHRRRRRGPAARRAGDARLPQPARRDGRRVHRRRLLPHRRHRRARRRRLPADHRPQEGPDQDLRRQVRRAVAHRGHVQGDLPVHLAGRSSIGQARNFCTMLVTLDPDAIAALGRGRAAGRASRTRRSSASTEARETGRAATSRSSTRSSTAGRPSRSSPSCRATCPSRTASSPRR